MLCAIASLLVVPSISGADVAVDDLDSRIESVTISPPQLELVGPNMRFLLLVDGKTKEGRTVDLTGRARFSARDGAVAVVSPDGVVRSVADGQSEVVIEVAGRSLRVPVTIRDTNVPHAFHFENDIIPLLTRYGCNTSGCHGKAGGQNGFKLSVFGFQPEEDFAALTKEHRGRRVNKPIPESSLLLQKSSGVVPHGGGIRMRRGSGDYRTLRDWIVAGAPFGDADAPSIVKVEVNPRERQLAMKAKQQLRVVATYTDGRRVDVTGHAKFQSNNEGLATVDQFGAVTVGETPGDVAIMVTFMGAVDVFRSLIPRGDKIDSYPPQREHNFIDPLVNAKLQKLSILPSGPADDATFQRRVYLDIIGTLPTPAETREFLADKRADRRTRLVDALLQRPEYADYQALKWSDLLRVDRLALGHKRAYDYYRWIRDSFRDNKPLDQFATDLLTASGPVREVPAANFYKVANDPHKQAATASQVFLGVRIECAHCHHHPFDRWSQTDYFGMHAYFTQVGFKGGHLGERISADGTAKSIHPRTGTEIFAHPLATAAPNQSPDGDRRRLLAQWMTSADNPWFARNIANRAWAHFMGRGLVEPVDDFRLTNPPSNPELLDALARDFVDKGYDYKELVRTITSSAAYGRSSTVNETNRRDEQNYSRYLFKRLDAEVFYDAITDVTGVSEKFEGVPAGSRAIQLWDSQVPHYFLKTFGRPYRATACSCERVTAPTVGQVLHVLNSPEIQGKLSHEAGRIAGLLRNDTPDAQIVEELTLVCFSRYPTKQEQDNLIAYLSGKLGEERKRAVEDVAWSMMNSMEFLFNH